MWKKSFILFSLFLIVSTSVFAKPPTNARKPVYHEAVSLGYGCQVAFQLESNNVRAFSYPFDWFHTSFSALISFIENEGRNFFDRDKIYVEGPYAGHPNFLFVRDLVYGILSYHDFYVSPPMINYDDVKEKYDRRIQRFFSLLNSQKRVLLVRQNSSRAEIEVLDDTLQRLYPHLLYTILAVGEESEYLEDWNLKRVKNFYIKQLPNDWRGDSERWSEVLSQFNIFSYFKEK